MKYTGQNNAKGKQRSKKDVRKNPAHCLPDVTFLRNWPRLIYPKIYL